jgi:CheY-like chemotaxis protein
LKKAEPARIVVIEDNPADVTLLRLALDAQGDPYQLEVLSDGEQALRFVREYASMPGTPEPCVLILDLHLPNMMAWWCCALSETLLPWQIFKWLFSQEPLPTGNAWNSSPSTFV